MIAVGVGSKEVCFNARLAQNGFGTSCKTGTRITKKQLMPCSTTSVRTRNKCRWENIKFTHFTFIVCSCMVIPTLTFSCIFNVYRFRTERRVVYTFAIDAAMRGKNYRKKRCAFSDTRCVRYCNTLCLTINCMTSCRDIQLK